MSSTIGTWSLRHRQRLELAAILADNGVLTVDSRAWKFEESM